MKTITKIFLFLFTYATSHTIVVLAYPASKALVASLTAPSLAVVAGLLIGAVGVFLGSFGNLYAVLKSTAERDPERLAGMNDLVSKISRTTNEVKQNVFFVMAVLAATLILPFLAVSNIPAMTWPFQPHWLSKTIVFTSLNLWLTILAFVAIFDCIGAMFLLHRHYEEAIKEWLNRSNR
jgi:hypothetical protein